MRSRLDHLVYATPDLWATVRELEKLLGAAATLGGRHPAWGTRNALLSLGPRVYLEVIGPDPAVGRSADRRPYGLEGLRAPRLSTWVARDEKLESVVRTARSLGVELGEVQRRSREKPDWGDSPHPAVDAAVGCRLHAFGGVHPDADRIRSVLRGLDLDLPVTPGEKPCLIAEITGPKGKLEIR